MDKSNIDIEHYKSVREEYLILLKQMEGLWHYKFTVVAITIIIAFIGQYILNAVDNPGELLKGTKLASIGLLMAPIFAFVVDLRMLEKAMYLKRISKYLQNQLTSYQIQNWESHYWESDFSVRRTLFAFFHTIGISLIISIVVFLIVTNFHPEWKRVLILCCIPIILVPLIILIRLIPSFLK